MIQRALLFAGGDTIEASHIVFDRPVAVTFQRTAPVTRVDAGRSAGAHPTLGNVVQMSEFAAIRETLAACGGSRIETAKRLGISERTLRYRLAKAREQGEDIVASVAGQLGMSGVGPDRRRDERRPRDAAARADPRTQPGAAPRQRGAGARRAATATAKPTSFADTLEDALKGVNDGQTPGRASSPKATSAARRSTSPR